MTAPAPRRSGARVQVGLVVLAGFAASALTWLIACAWPDAPAERATIASVAFIPLWTVLALAVVAVRRRAPAGSERRRLFAVHRGLGGALALAAMVVFGSGVGAVADRALARWQVALAPVEAPPLAEQPLDAVLADLLTARPELVRGELAIHPASDHQPWIQVDFFGPGRKPVRLDFDARTGAPLAQGRGPLWVVRELHRRLLTNPLLGETVLGALGLALALILCTGLAARRDWLRNLVRRRRPAQPLAMRVHQWVGFFTLPAALLWAWTGALLGLTLIVVPIVGGAAYGGDRAALMRDVLASDRPPLVDTAIARPTLQTTIASGCPLVAEHLADAEVHRVLVRHPGLASGTVRVDLEGGGLLERGSFTRAADGALRDCRALPAAGPGLQAFLGAIVLHYGEWGPAWFVDLAYLLLGAGLVGLSWLGGVLLARRRERDGETRSAARLRRWLIGVGLGLPLATAALLLLSRIPALARAEDLAVRVFVAVFVLALLLARTFSRAPVILHHALVVLLVAVPIVGWLVAGVQPGLVEAVLVVMALGLLGVRRRPLAPV
ncbi:PepSY-associated TM helix domain-containing protein [Nannocystis sp. SCPEA4]|uniref:PepSY-associated TM helix domain-containing protein n=1 Tax=Nannocystis sp. SCPEA4 TaxID=2996787 RepID=UPI0022712AAA|nr:PepSY-associated TM helix domain-containing protein [Nannocystis sp. SCPEA4]MCY1055053.1 PepSY-associated TM helix domain-containing protein [Nannocystis sp. SCPEA4]